MKFFNSQWINSDKDISLSFKKKIFRSVFSRKKILLLNKKKSVEKKIKDEVKTELIASLKEDKDVDDENLTKGNISKVDV